MNEDAGHRTCGVGEKRPLKVIRVIARLNIGGPARHAVILGDGLRAHGFETILVHGVPGPGEGDFADLAAARGLSVVCIPDLRRGIHAGSDVRAFARLLRLVFIERPDVVHTHTAKAGVVGRLAALIYNGVHRRQRRCLVIHTFHGNVLSSYFGAVGSAAARLVERALASLSDRIITISPSQRQEIVERFRVAPAPKVAMIPLGLELDELLRLAEGAESLRGELGFAAGDIVFGYVGRLVPIKGLETLLSGFRLVVDEIPHARLMLVGDGESRGSLEKLARDLGQESRVRFTGWRRDLAAVYSTCDVVVLTSLNEGTPVALIEGMAAARPVVGSRVGGVGDLIRNGETGVLFSAGDTQDLARALVRLARDDQERERLGRAARASVSAGFHRERLITEMRDLYLSALQQKRRSWGTAGRAASAGGPR